MSLSSLWDRFVSFFIGENIAILGQRATGKTSLLTFILTGKVVTEHHATVSTRKLIKKSDSYQRMQNIGCSLRICDSLKDYSGSSDNFKNDWIEAAKESSVFIYLFNVAHWIEDPHSVESQILIDINFLAPYLDGKKTGVFFIGTHADQINFDMYPKYRNYSNISDDLSNELFFNTVIANVQQYQIKTPVVLHCADLHTKHGLESLINILFKGK